MKFLETSTVASLSTSATNISILENATTPSPHVSLSSGFRCQCAVPHTTEIEGCFEYSTFSILSKVHLALLEDFKSAQLIPRNPSLANLLLLDIHSNPVVSSLVLHSSDKVLPCLPIPWQHISSCIGFFGYVLLAHITFKIFPLLVALGKGSLEAKKQTVVAGTSRSRVI
jgi:hypothetical protein